MRSMSLMCSRLSFTGSAAAGAKKPRTTSEAANRPVLLRAIILVLPIRDSSLETAQRHAGTTQQTVVGRIPAGAVAQVQGVGMARDESGGVTGRERMVQADRTS